MVAAIQDLNQTKKTYRDSLKKVTDLEDAAKKAQDEAKAAKQQTDELKEKSKATEELLAEQKRQNAQLDEKRVELEDKIAQLKKAPAPQPGPTPVQTAAPGEEGAAPAGPGVKGTVVAVNSKWNFVVLSLTDDFMHELLGPELSGQLAGAELMVKRSGKPEKFITKVKLVSISKEKKLAVADILPSWSQGEVQEGDAVSY